LVIGNRWQDSPLARAERVDNNLGLPGRTGKEILEEFCEHARQVGVEFAVGRAISLMSWNGFLVTVGSQVYEGRALILATGVQRQVKYPGETEYLGRGVSYCATCDGMLYRGKPVAVIGRAPDAPHEANYLKDLGCQVVYLSGQTPEGLRRDIPFIRANSLAIKGERTVTGLEADGATIPCAGVFILRQAVASADLLPALEMENGAVKVDRNMATNLSGVFAAGDCNGPPLQVAKAVGEGHVAALSACAYLDAKNKETKDPRKGA
jgi:thioredoxin reductase (NADPH)